MSSDWRSALTAGTRIDIYDVAYSDWYRGRILEICSGDKTGKVKVTYDGYASDFDEYIEVNSWRLAEFSAHTTDAPRVTASSSAANTDRIGPTLTGAQLQTYQELLRMGFDAADCSAVAQIFGSNLEGAINAILSGNVSRLTRTVSSNRTRLRDLISFSMNRSSEQESNRERDRSHLFKLSLSSKDGNNEPVSPLFRVTRVHHLLLNGYIRELDELEYIIHGDIQTLILKYLNLYFLKFLYHRAQGSEQSHGQKMIERGNEDEKQDDDVAVDVEEHRYFALDKNATFRQVIRTLETHYKYDYEELSKKIKEFDPHYCYFIRFWTKFKHLKSIYCLKAGDARAISRDIAMRMIEKHGYDTNANQDRWVEIPNDFEDATILDFDTLFAQTDKYGVLELGVDRFNSCTKQWTFRAANNSTYVDEIHRLKSVANVLPPEMKCNDQVEEGPVQCVLCTGLPNELTPLHLWKAIEQVSNQKLTVPKRPKRWGAEALVYVQNVDLDKLIKPGETARICVSDDSVIGMRLIGSEQEQSWIRRHCGRTSIEHATAVDFEWYQKEESVDPEAAPTPAPLPRVVIKRVAKNWKCVHCQTRNHKTYVICGGCFTDKDETQYEYEEVVQGDKAEAHDAPKLPVDVEALGYLGGVKKAAPPILASKAPIPGLQWTKQLQIGDIIDVMDEQDKWYEAVIRYIEINNGQQILYVHYIGWSKKWDEAVFANDIQKVAMRNTKTVGPHRPKLSSFSSKQIQQPSNHYPAFKRKLDEVNACAHRPAFRKYGASDKTKELFVSEAP